MESLINPARVDFVTLHLFCTVARTGSITKGADACHLALSAASRRLSDFEAATGSKLLKRSSLGVELTPAGHVALQHAMRLYHGFERFGSELRDYSLGVRGHVRLWANMSALSEFLPASLSSFMQTHPEIRIEVEEQLSGDIVRALVDGLADLGVFAEETPGFGLDVEEFQKDTLVVVCAPTHPISRHSEIDFRSCLAHNFVGLNRGSALLELTSRAAEREGLPLKLSIQVRSFAAMCKMIAAKLGIGILPLEACQEHIGALGLVVVNLRESWSRRGLLIGMAKGRQLPVAVDLLRSHLLAQPRA